MTREHLERFCPLRGLKVPEGVQDHIFRETAPALSVGVVDTDQPGEDIKAKLEDIRKEVIKTCGTCDRHIKNGGGCKPGSILRGGLVATVLVADRDEFPSEIKADDGFYYEDC
jgi:hypothetical protein